MGKQSETKFRVHPAIRAAIRDKVTATSLNQLIGKLAKEHRVGASQGGRFLSNEGVPQKTFERYCEALELLVNWTLTYGQYCHPEDRDRLAPEISERIATDEHAWSSSLWEEYALLRKSPSKCAMSESLVKEIESEFFPIDPDHELGDSDATQAADTALDSITQDTHTAPAKPQPQDNPVSFPAIDIKPSIPRNSNQKRTLIWRLGTLLIVTAAICAFSVSPYFYYSNHGSSVSSIDSDLEISPTKEIGLPLKREFVFEKAVFTKTAMDPKFLDLMNRLFKPDSGLGLTGAEKTQLSEKTISNVNVKWFKAFLDSELMTGSNYIRLQTPPSGQWIWILMPNQGETKRINPELSAIEVDIAPNFTNGTVVLVVLDCPNVTGEIVARVY